MAITTPSHIDADHLGQDERSQLERDEAARIIMMENLGVFRRENATTGDEDYKRKYRHFGGVGQAQLEASRASNQTGTGSARRAKEDKAALSAWSNLQNRLEDVGDIEPLEDIMGGQSHRARLNAEINAVGGQAYAQATLDDIDERHDPALGLRGGRGGHGGRGGGIIGSRGRGGFKTGNEHIPSSRPLDPAIDPDREYYLTRKKAKAAATQPGAPPIRGGGYRSRSGLSSMGRGRGGRGEIALTGGRLQGTSAGVRVVSVSNDRPSPQAAALASPDDFLARVFANIRPGGPKPFILPQKLVPQTELNNIEGSSTSPSATTTIKQGLASSPRTEPTADIPFNQGSSKNDTENHNTVPKTSEQKSSALTHVSDDDRNVEIHPMKDLVHDHLAAGQNAAPVESTSVSSNPALALSSTEANAVRPEHRLSAGPTFDFLLARPAQFMDFAMQKTVPSRTIHANTSSRDNGGGSGSLDRTSVEPSDAAAFLAHIPAVPHPAPHSKAGSILTNAFHNPRSTRTSRTDLIIPLLNIPSEADSKSPGTDGLLSAVSESAVNFEEETPAEETLESDAGSLQQPEKAKKESLRIGRLSPQPGIVAVLEKAEALIISDKGQLLDIEDATSPALPNYSIDLLDISNDGPAMDTLSPSRGATTSTSSPMSKAINRAWAQPVANVGVQKRVKIAGKWYVLDANQESTDQSESTTEPVTLPMVDKRHSGHTDASSTDKSTRHARRNFFSASSRPPNYGRGSQMVTSDFLEDQKGLIMTHHNLTEAEYQTLDRGQKIKLAGEANRAICLHNMMGKAPGQHVRRPSALEQARIAPSPMKLPGAATVPPTSNEDEVAAKSTTLKRVRSSISELSHGFANVHLSSSPENVSKQTRKTSEPLNLKFDDQRSNANTIESGTGPVVSELAQLKINPLDAEVGHMSTRAVVDPPTLNPVVTSAQKTRSGPPKPIPNAIHPLSGPAFVQENEKQGSSGRPPLSTASTNPFRSLKPDPIYGGIPFRPLAENVSKHASGTPLNHRAEPTAPAAPLIATSRFANLPASHESLAARSGNVAGRKPPVSSMKNVPAWLRDALPENVQKAEDDEKGVSKGAQPTANTQHAIRELPKPARGLTGSKYAF